MRKGKKHNRRWHRWLGIPLGFIMVVFALSGIVLNHRHYFSDCEVNRAILPSLFQYKDWNNGFIRGSLELPDSQKFDSISGFTDTFTNLGIGQDYRKPEALVYGNDGVWLTDRGLTAAAALNEGFPKGVDNRGIRSVVMDRQCNLWATTQTDLWLYDYQGKRWTHQKLPIPSERLSDLTIKGDSLIVVGRSHLFIVDLKVPSDNRKEIETDNTGREIDTDNHQEIDTDNATDTGVEKDAKTYRAIDQIAPESFSIVTVNPSQEYSQGGRQTLFRIMLKVHSGEILGLKGRVIMDAIAIIFILMSVSGVVFYFAKKRKSCKSLTRVMFKYHKRLGIITFVLLLFVVFTGWTLRPPLLIALVTSNVGLEGDNVWEDKLRNIRYDQGLGQWLLSTSDGFYQMDSLEAIPEKVDAAPPVSVMGVNVWEPHEQGWLLGSFSGMYIWNTVKGKVWDYFTDEEVETNQKQGPPFGKKAVGGHFLQRPVEFYNGTDLGDMPAELRHEPISLWNLALEVHTGRIYTFMGTGSKLFIFIVGSLIIWLLVSGLRRALRKKRTSQKVAK